MKWLKFLTINKIPYYIYKLNSYDRIILKDSNEVAIILYGITYAIKTFINKELLPIGIFSKDHILTSNNIDKKTFYQIISLKNSYIAICSGEKFCNNISKIEKELEVLKNYAKTLETYKYINEVIVQKQAKARIIQLILYICVRFGKIKNNKIIIPFKISQECIALMTGLSKNTVNKAINKKNKIDIIENDKKTIDIKKILSIELE